MSTFTPTTKHSATMTVATKNSATMSPASKTLVNSLLLLESGAYILLENGFKIILEQSISTNPTFTTLVKS